MRVRSFATVFCIIGLGCAARTEAFRESSEPQPPASSSSTSAGEQQDDAPTSERTMGEAAWAKRSDKAQLEAAIGHWETAAQATPGDVELLSKLTRAHYFYAEANLRDDPDAYLERMNLAVEWGEKALKVASPEFAEGMRKGGKFYEEIRKAPKEAVPAMYWYAAALGRWSRASGIAKLIANKDNVKATMQTVTELSREYFHGGPDRYWGGFYAVAPPAFGGDIAKSKVHFEKSLELAPHYLGTRVLMADAYACHGKIDDKALFDRLIDEVLSADPTAVPELEPENRVEQAKASAMKAKGFDDFCE